MAKNRKKRNGSGKTLTPHARRTARRTKGDVVPAPSVLFNRHGELVIVDPLLSPEVKERIRSGGLIIREAPKWQTYPPPPPNALCGCRGYRLELLREMPPAPE